MSALFLKSSPASSAFSCNRLQMSRWKHIAWDTSLASLKQSCMNTLRVFQGLMWIRCLQIKTEIQTNRSEITIFWMRNWAGLWASKIINRGQRSEPLRALFYGVSILGHSATLILCPVCPTVSMPPILSYTTSLMVLFLPNAIFLPHFITVTSACQWKRC